MGELMGYNSSASQRGKGHAALADLTRTLEALEDRLDRVARAKSAPKTTEAHSLPNLISQRQRHGQTRGETGHRRADYADAVSQIVMRQKVLDQKPRPDGKRLGQSSQLSRGAPNRLGPQSVGAQGTRSDRRKAKQETTSVNDMKSELNRLRDELTRNLSSDVSEQVEDMRSALADLQSAVVQNARPEIVRSEIARLHDRLDQMDRSGMDPAIVLDMRSHLDHIDDCLERRSASSVGRYASTASRQADEHASLETNDRADLKADIARLRESLSHLASEDHLNAVEQRWTDFEERFIAEVGSKDRTAELTDRMMAEMVNLREQLKEFAADHSARATESLWNGVEARFTPREETEESIARIGDRIASLEEALATLPDALPFDGIDRRIEALAEAIERISVQVGTQGKDDERFSNVDTRLDEITRAIATLADAPVRIDVEPIERIEARMRSLAERVDDIASDGSVAILAEKLTELTGRIESIAEQEPNAHLVEQIGRLNERLDDLAEQNGVSHEDMAAIETRLSSLAQRIETQLATPLEDGEAIANLENQVSRLAEFLNSDNFAVPADMERRLSDLERQVEQNGEQIFLAAKSAADEAVRQMLEQGDFTQSEHVSKLTEELEKLQALSNDTHVRSTDFYEAVNAALSRLVERIDAIERDFDKSARASQANASNETADQNRASSSFDAPVVDNTGWGTPDLSGNDAEADTTTTSNGLRALLSKSFKKRNDKGNAIPVPGWTGDEVTDNTGVMAAKTDPEDQNSSIDAADALESEEANRPLAIGSGTPDIAALLERVRNQKADTKQAADDDNKADFIAAARRAAMAAAEEAEGFNDQNQPDRQDGSVSETISRRRRPIMLAASAVLLALLALPAGKLIVEKTKLFSADPIIATAPQSNANTSVAETASIAPASSSSKVAGVAEPVIGISDEPKNEVANSKPTSSESLSANLTTASPVKNAAFSPDGPVRQVGPTVSASKKRFDQQVAALPEGIGSEPLLEAAKAGDPKALFEIGLRLMEGRTVSSDPAKAATWFERSADIGFAPAQYSLGTLYEKGNGVERDTIAARDWYLKAAESGNVRAMHNLAVLFATGVDGKSEPDLAADWFIKAAEHGMTDSQYNLGILFARGAGVEQDLSKSYKWFAIVGQSGDKDATDKRDEVAKSLSPEQLAKAKSDVANFTVLERSDQANTVDIPEEWAAVAAKPMTTASVDMTRAVRNIQAILGKLGYDAGAPDGLVGARTTNAIKAFQKDAGLAVTGEIDEKLIRALLDRRQS